MPFLTSVHFDTSGITDRLEERFGAGSPGQYAWSKIVFQGSEEYVPFRTGRFLSYSLMASLETMADGEIRYVAPPEYGFPGLPRFLWNGLSPSGKPLNFTHLASRSGLEGAQWTDRAKNDRLPMWIAEMQEKVDRGEI